MTSQVPDYAKVTFVDDVSGHTVRPDNWIGNIPMPGHEYYVGDACYTVVRVEINNRHEVNVGLLPTNHPAPMPENKATNPKDVVGVTKSPMSVVPAPFLHALGLAMLEGALKYGRHNYRAAGVRYSVYYDAAMRHMHAWWEGEDIDPDSGLPHPVKAAACLCILHDALMNQNGNDDRPPRSPAGWLGEMNERTKELLARYPDPVPPHTEKTA